MTDCGCDKARAELEEYLHNELCSTDVQDVAEHLANCADCSDEHLVGLTLMQKVQTACRGDVAPADLRAAVLRQIDLRR